MKIEVLYEDNDILVAVKPYGLPSQPDKKNSENMVSMLKLRIFEKEHRTEEPYLAPIHRLDRPVGRTGASFFLSFTICAILSL